MKISHAPTWMFHIFIYQILIAFWISHLTIKKWWLQFIDWISNLFKSRYIHKIQTSNPFKFTPKCWQFKPVQQKMSQRNVRTMIIQCWILKDQCFSNYSLVQTFQKISEICSVKTLTFKLWRDHFGDELIEENISSLNAL